jgi:4-hydroxythreonine-4-phosphate dehydrogenase
MNAPKPLALTVGEPAGIGPDLTLALWLRRAELDLPPFYLIGDTDFLRRRARALGLDVALTEVTPGEAAAAYPRALPVVPLGLPIDAAPGRPDATSAPAAIAAIRRAVDDVLAGEAAGIVTNPIAKSVLSRAGFAEPGIPSFSDIWRSKPPASR